MSRFINSLRIEDTGEFIHGLKVFRLLEPFDCEVRLQAGFKTDLWSVPKILWTIMPQPDAKLNQPTK